MNGMGPNRGSSSAAAAVGNHKTAVVVDNRKRTVVAGIHRMLRECIRRWVHRIESCGTDGHTLRVPEEEIVITFLLFL